MKILNPISWVEDKGGLHDVFVESLQADFLQKEVVVVVEDVNANLAGLDGYRRTKCDILFHDVETVYLDIENLEGVAISNARITLSKKLYLFEAELRYGGASNCKPSIILSFASMSATEEEDIRITG